MSALDDFAADRDLLFTIAYELTGSAVDAEDVVQETWLRWSAVPDGEARDPRSYLCRIASRLALNRLRTRSRSREDYPGPWLPEPVSTTRDLLDDLVLAESVSEAMLIVLDTLSPEERAAFVLHEVFDVPIDEIAATLRRTAVATRQLLSRARARVKDRRPNPRAAPSADLTAALVEAIRTQDAERTRALLADDVVFIGDGGGKATSARNPIHGADHVARFLVGIGQSPFTLTTRLIGGEDALVIDLVGADDRSVLRMTTSDGAVARITAVRNPDKLTAVDAPRRLVRR